MVNVKLWSGKSWTHQDAPLTSNIGEIKSKIGKDHGISTEELEIVFCGRRLPNDSTLSSFGGIREHSTIYVLKRKQQEKKSVENTEIDPSVVDALVTSFRTALMDPQHRTLLFSIISNSEGLSSLISATPGLEEDTLVQGILKDPFLLVHWLTSDNVKELIVGHPCLVEAGQQIMSSLHQEAASLGVDRATMMFVQGSDDEENSDGEGDNAQGGDLNQRENAGQAQITTDQLAAALAAAGAPRTPVATRLPLNVPAEPTGAGTSTESAGSGPITPDAFQRALLQAFRGQAQQQQPQPEMDISAGMMQLKDMGFTDENENRRALLASGGDFQAALEFIITERERMEAGMGLD